MAFLFLGKFSLMFESRQWPTVELSHGQTGSGSPHAVEIISVCNKGELVPRPLTVLSYQGLMQSFDQVVETLCTLHRGSPDFVVPRRISHSNIWPKLPEKATRQVGPGSKGQMDNFFGMVCFALWICLHYTLIMFHAL